MAISDNLKKYNDMNKAAKLAGGVDNYKNNIAQSNYKKGSAVGGSIGALVGTLIGIKLGPKIIDFISNGINKIKQKKKDAEILKIENKEDNEETEIEETEGGENSGNIECK